jgi:hypothetical protein
MKVTKFLAFMLCSVLAVSTLNSCGKDEPTQPKDEPLTEKGELVGTFNGIVDVKPTTGTFQVKTDNAAKVQLANYAGDNSKMNLTVWTPAEIGGPIVCSNFMVTVDKTYYYFNIQQFTGNTYTGNDIPDCIFEWWGSQYNISKIIMHEFKFENVKYVVATKELEFVATVGVDIYEGDTKVVPTTLTYTFRSLKK